MSDGVIHGFFFFFSSPLFSPGVSEGSGSTPVISYGRVTAGQKPSYSVGDVITIECYTGYTLHGEAQIQYIGDNQWAPAVPTCQLSKYGLQKLHWDENISKGTVLLYLGEII